MRPLLNQSAKIIELANSVSELVVQEADALAKNEPENDLEPSVAVRNLSLPPKLVKRLNPALERLGYSIASTKIEGPYNRDFELSLVRNHRWQGYFAHIKKAILGESNEENKAAMLSVSHTFGRAFRNTDSIVLLSVDLSTIALAFDGLFRDLERDERIRVRFIPWDHVIQLFEIAKRDDREFIKTFVGLFGIEVSDPKPQDLVDDDMIEEVVDILKNQAVGAPAGLGPAGYFRDLVHRTRLPDDWVAEVIGVVRGLPEVDARELVKWALNKGGNPAEQGCTTLESLLKVELSKLGDENRQKFERVISALQQQENDA